MRRSYSRTRRASRPRRKLIWARTLLRVNLNSEGDGGATGFNEPTRFYPLDDFENAYGANLIGCTVERIRGRLTVVNGATALARTTAVRVGFRITDKVETEPTGVGSLFDPSAQTGGAHDDWFGWTSLLAVPAASRLDNGPGLASSIVDHKVARKITELGSALELAASARDVDLVGASTGVDVALHGDFSVLVMLP